MTLSVTKLIHRRAPTTGSGGLTGFWAKHGTRDAGSRFWWMAESSMVYNWGRRLILVMHANVNGKIHGDRIDLDRILNEFPDGADVTVSVTAREMSIDEKHRVIDALCGSWRDDASIGPIFEEIARERAASAERSVNIDDPS